MGGHGHGHHHEPYTVPDYKTYKVVDAPQLVEVEKMLSRQGLKDPWLRNEVWRHGKVFGTHRQRLTALLFRGLPLGFAAFLVTLAIEKTFGVDWHNPRNLPKYAHGHGHEEHGEEGGHH